MDSKILDLMQHLPARLPKKTTLADRYRQYECTKRSLAFLCPDGETYAALCKALAERYEI